METNEGTFHQNDTGNAEEPSLGFGAKLWNLFIDPRKTFSSVRRNHEWVILWLIVAAISIGGFLPVKGIVQKTQIAQVEEQLDKNPNIPAEQREEILDRVRGQFDNPVMMLVVPITQLVILVIVAAVLMFLGNILLGGNVGFLKMLNASAWAAMVALPATLVTVPMIMAKGSMDVSLGLGVLASPETGPFSKEIPVVLRGVRTLAGVAQCDCAVGACSG